MRRIALLAPILIATSFVSSISAEVTIKDKSPDGTAALRILYSENDWAGNKWEKKPAWARSDHRAYAWYETVMDIRHDLFKLTTDPSTGIT